MTRGEQADLARDVLRAAFITAAVALTVYLLWRSFPVAAGG